VISRLFYPGQDGGVTSIVPLSTRLFRKGVTLTPHTALIAVGGSTIVVANAFTGAQESRRGATRDRRLRRTARNPPGHPRGHACGARDL